jgi:hypothetical protein
MATIKRYTDISQAKILDEILSSKGADMCFKCFGEETYDLTFCEVSYSEWAKEYKELFDKAGLQLIPCWNLSALISIIPQELFDGEYIINITEGRNHKWIISYEHYSEVSSYIDVSSDSLIDCCVEMIIKLKKRNLL